MKLWIDKVWDKVHGKPPSGKSGVKWGHEPRIRKSLEINHDLFDY